MPSFIFDISNSDLDGSTTIPLTNVYGSFTGLTSDFRTDGLTTTITIVWSSYTNNQSHDGVNFTVVSYYNKTSINIKQFGGITLSVLPPFAGFRGTISATDTPIVNNLSGAFAGANCKNYDFILNWDVSRVTNFGNIFSDSNFLDIGPSVGKWNFSSATSFREFFGNSFFRYTSNITNSIFLIDLCNNATVNNKDFGNLTPHLNSAQTVYALKTLIARGNTINTNLVKGVPSNFKSLGYAPSDLTYIGYTLNDLTNAGYTQSELSGVNDYTGWTLNSLLAGGQTFTDLVQFGYTASNFVL